MPRILLFLLLTASAALCQAQREPMIVGTKIAPPFVIKLEDGSYTGISIELWKDAAETLGLAYEFREADLQGLIEGLENGRFDIAVAALTVTAPREERVDFTHPFHTTGLAIAVPQQGSPVWVVVKRLFSWEFLVAVGGLAALLLVVGLLLWLAERHKNKAQFGGSPAEGIGASFWWAAVTMTTVGYGDKAPITFAGRLVALVWMFAGLIIVSSFTAAIATALTVSQLETGVKGVQDLPNVRVATVTDSASAEYLRGKGIRFDTTPELQAAVQGLVHGQYDALVYDKPILQYLANQEYPKRTQILPGTIERQDYAFALPHGSPLREPLNRALLEIISGDGWQTTLTRYLGQQRE